jgi:5,10-methylenetetrahydrofolate reductase
VITLFDKRYPLTLELLSPRGCETNGFDAVSPIVDKLDAVTVTDNPMATLRASSIAYGSRAKEKLHLDVIPNLSCRDRNLLALQSEIIGADMLGHHNLFIITGDTPRDRKGFRPVWEVNSIELCGIVKGLNDGTASARGTEQVINSSTRFTVGGALVFDRVNEQDTLRKKVDAGFDYFISQISFDAEQVEGFFAEAEERGDRVDRHVQIGLAPMSTPRRLRAVSQMPGIKIRDTTLEKLEGNPDFVGGVISHLADVADDLKSSLSTYSIGFHLMPIGSDEATNRLVRELI